MELQAFPTLHGMGRKSLVTCFHRYIRWNYVTTTTSTTSLNFCPAPLLLCPVPLNPTYNRLDKGNLGL